MERNVESGVQERGMARAAAYLAIPKDYCSDLGGGVRWSGTGDLVIEYADGSTFAFALEVANVLEGFVSQRPLIPFGCLLRLLYLMRPKPETPAPSPSFALLRSACRQTRGNPYDAGVFAAQLCRDVPPAPDPPGARDLWHWMLARQAGAVEPPGADGEMPPLAPPAFEARVERALDAYDFETMVHWLGHGCGPERQAAEQLAEAVVHIRPPSLGSVFADLARRERLSGAVPFVAQLVSALTLPPRRLSPPELPLGGYADVTTRGHLEQVLPSQLAYDDLEFVRRLAQHELLFFRREDPHVRTREDLVVLLDQGVRTWGVVRLVLTAAAFALGRLAERRGIPYLLASTAGTGDLYDPLTTPSAELGERLEASDLSPHPGFALESVLEAETAVSRDVVLLTHARNLTADEVCAAARRVRPGTRLFAVGVDHHGAAQVAELRHGSLVPLGQFRIDLTQTPSSAPTPAGGTMWRGDVEPVPYPFQFGVGSAGDSLQHFAFDHAGEWLLTATRAGTLYATRTDGSRTEVLPRGLLDGKEVTEVDGVLGVAGGFVVTARSPAFVAVHYDFATRTCAAHRFEPTADRISGILPIWYYLRRAHTLILRHGAAVQCLQLSTGNREVPAAVQALCRTGGPQGPGPYSAAVLRLPLQESPPANAASPWSWPWLGFAPDVGRLTPMSVNPVWEPFTPLADGQSVLRGVELLDAACQGSTLAALFRKAPGNVATHLYLFRGPEGTPLAEFHQPRAWKHFALSSDGRLLARQEGSQVEVRDVVRGGPLLCVTPRGRFHHDAEVELGDGWLSVQIAQTIHLVHWGKGRLTFRLGHGGLATFLSLEIGGGKTAIRGIQSRPGRRPEWLIDSSPGRFRAAAWGNLIAVVDCFSQVALFDHDHKLVCMVFAFRQQIAAWMPDGTCCGPLQLLGTPATPGAAEVIGQALCAAEGRGAGRTVG